MAVTVMGEVNWAAYEQIVSTTVINMASGTAQQLFAPPAANKLIPTRFVFRDPTAAMVLGALSIGFVSSTYIDIVASATYVSLSGAGKYLIVNPISAALYGTAGAALFAKVNVTQASTSITIDTFGYLL